MTRLERALEVVERIIEWVGIVIMVAMLLISIAEIVASDILNSPIAGSLDLTLLIMIWMVLLVSGIGVHSDLHIRVAFFVDTMSVHGQRIIGLIVFVAIFIFGLSVLFVFLALAAQYESWSLPLAIILIVPMSVLSAMVGVTLRGFEAAKAKLEEAGATVELK